MRSLLPISILLLTVGCFNKPRSASVDLEIDVSTDNSKVSYVMLSEPPDAILDEMASKYTGDTQEWQKQWRGDNFSSPMDGQRALELLEIACFADVTCHRVEHPLRKATLDLVKEKLESPGVKDAIEWITTSYQSGLPLDEPGDETGYFKGMRVQAMKTRMTDYARQLLGPLESHNQ